MPGIIIGGITNNILLNKSLARIDKENKMFELMI